MKFVLVALIAVVVALNVYAQLPPGRVDEATLGPLEKQIPMDHYCKRADLPIDPKREPRAHACSCAYSCTLEKDEHGNVTGISEEGGEHSSACKSYCSKNGRRCTCHPEEPCVGNGNALLDMDGNLVAMVRPSLAR